MKFIEEVKFNAIELRPYYHALELLPVFREVWQGDYYVAGFVNTREKMEQCKKAGFRGAIDQHQRTLVIEVVMIFERYTSG